MCASYHCIDFSCAKPAENGGSKGRSHIISFWLCCNYVLIISLLTIIIKQTLNSKILLVVLILKLTYVNNINAYY